MMSQTTRRRAQEVRLRHQPDRITAQRAKRVDFLAPYFTAPQAAPAPRARRFRATTLAQLADAQIGVQVGTTSLDAVSSSIKPKSSPQA